MDQSDYGSDCPPATASSVASRENEQAFPPLPAPGPSTQPAQTRPRLKLQGTQPPVPPPTTKATAPAPLLTSSQWDELMQQVLVPGAHDAIEQALRFRTEAQSIPVAQRTNMQSEAI